MRKNWLLIGVGLLVAVLAIGAIACDDDDDDDDGNGDGNGDVVTRLIATLAAEGDGSGTGSATLTEVNGVAQIEVTMEGLIEGTHANHVHHGSCAAQGEVHVTLQELVAGADGAASGTTLAEPPAVDPAFGLDHFVAGHYIAVHEVGGAPGAVVSCGDVVAP